MSTTADTARSIVVLLETGDAQGPRVAHLPMSTIRAFAFQREDFAEAIELFGQRWQRPGTYLLYGADVSSSDQVPTVYVGESEQVASRLRTHNSTAANSGASDYTYWSETIVLVSEDDSLSKGHVRYVERALTQAARANGEWVVKSGRDPGPGAGELPRHDSVSADRFIQEAKLLTGVLGLDLFKLQPLAQQPAVQPGEMQTSAPTISALSPTFILKATNMPGPAKMQVTGDSSFVVLSNSTAAAEAVSSLSPSYRRLRETLKNDGILKEGDGQLAFTADHAFRSIAAVTQVVSGSTLNGRVAWSDDGGKTYGQWEAERAEAAAKALAEPAIGASPGPTDPADSAKEV
ncbi:GIY-YIG nuclease family protein [Devosia sp.]|uniref:GIY-YIG nuclease family protein n=1 Tax=Devosia sp. TaxID=1871048 RepID=UPI0035B2E326